MGAAILNCHVTTLILRAATYNLDVLKNIALLSKRSEVKTRIW